jgi:hypothetical protein
VSGGVAGVSQRLRTQLQSAGRVRASVTASAGSSRNTATTTSIEIGHQPGVSHQLASGLSTVADGLRDALRESSVHGEEDGPADFAEKTGEAAEQLENSSYMSLSEHAETASNVTKLGSSIADAKIGESFEPIGSRLEVGMSSVEILGGANKLASSLLSAAGDHKKWGDFNTKIKTLSDASKKMLEQLVKKFPDSAKDIRNFSNPKIRNSDVLTTNLKAALGKKGFESLKDLSKAKMVVQGLKTESSDFKAKTLAKHATNMTSITSAGLSSAKGIGGFVGTVGKHLAKVLGTVTAGIGLGTTSIKMVFDTRAMIRAGKSFFRSKTSSAKLKDVMNKVKTPHQKQKLSQLQKNVHRIAKKKIADKVKAFFGSGIGIGASVAGFALGASNPVGWALMGAGLAVGIGYAIYSKHRSNRHTKKLKKQRSVIENKVTSMQVGLKAIKLRLSTVPPGVEGDSLKMDILKSHGFSSAKQFNEVSKKVNENPITSLDTGNGKNSVKILNQMSNLAKLGTEVINAQLKNDGGSVGGAANLGNRSDFLRAKINEGGNPKRGVLGRLHSKMEELEKNLKKNPNDTRKSFGLSKKSSDEFVLNHLYNQAKEEVLSGILQANKMSGRDMAKSVDDVRSRDESVIDESFKDMYESASGDKQLQKAVVNLYSNVSVSKGSELKNEAFLKGDVSQSSFQRFADITTSEE